MQKFLKQFASIPFILIPIIIFFISQPVLAVNQQESNTSQINTIRLFGNDRYQTARVIAEKGASDTVNNVILTTGFDFPDALTSSVFAKKLNAPILLLNTTVDGSSEAFAYIQNHLAPKGNIYIIGGTGVISKSFSLKLNQMGFNNSQIHQIGGLNRYETATLIAQQEQVTAGTPVVIVSAEGFADALSVSSIAASKGWPILLVSRNNVSTYVQNFLANEKPSKVYFIGGSTVISDAVKSQIESLIPTAATKRLYGNDRFETGMAVTNEFISNLNSIYVCSGMDFADALAGSVLAGQMESTIVLINPTFSRVPLITETFLRKLRNSQTPGSINVTILGGAAAVPDGLVDNIQTIIAGHAPLLMNAPQYMSTLTYDGSGQVVHPSIVDFKTEYNLDNWNGFRYWMAYTPYPYGDDAYENPSIIASNDGQNWVVPSGLKNPLEDIPSNYLSRKNYNSDPELIYDPDNKCLNLFWREQGTYEKIWRIRILSSLSIEPKVLCVEERRSDGEGLALSPTVWRKNANEWYMWTANGNSFIHLYSSKDGINWSKRQRCNTPWSTWNGGYVPWHIEAKPNYREQRVEFFINGWPKETGKKDKVLFYAEVPMDDITNFKMPLSNVILAQGSEGNWDNNFIYRTTFTIEAEQSAYKYHVWYSAQSKSIVWHIGYTEGELGTYFTQKGIGKE